MKSGAKITGILLLFFAIGALFQSTKLPFGGLSTPGPGFFPAVLGALLTIISLLILIDSIRHDAKRADHAEQPTWHKIAFTVGALLAFGFLLESLGYLVTTFLFVTFALRAVEGRSWRLAAAMGFAASLGSYVIFGLLLGAPLPQGLLRI